MSFDLFVWDPPSRDCSDAGVASYYVRTCEGEEGEEGAADSPRLAAFLEEVFTRYPSLDALSDDEVDDSPWNGGEGRSTHWAVFTVRWSMATQMRAWLVERALRHGLVIFDPQAMQVLRPPEPARS